MEGELKEQLLVAIPTFNERDNIEPLLKLFSEVPLDLHILFVDDNSPDGTAALIEELQKDSPNLFLLKRPGRLGIGSAHRDAILYAYQNGYKTFATMDADLTHDPHSLPKLLERAPHADIVLGSRYLLPDSLPGWNIVRRLLTYSGHFVTCFFLKMPYDATGGLRVYNLASIPEKLFGLVRSNGYSFLYESLFILWTNGCRVLEVPIALPARSYGSSKMSFQQILVSVFRLVLLYTNIRAIPDLYRLKDTGGLQQTEISNVESRRGIASESATSLLSEIYETWVGSTIRKPALERTMRQVFRQGEKVLHAGCGSGQVDQVLRHWMNISACDTSRDALAMYSQVNWPYCQTRLAEGKLLPYSDAEFDGVYTLRLMNDASELEIAALLSEFHRVLKNKGRLVVSWSGGRQQMEAHLGKAGFRLLPLDSQRRGFLSPVFSIAEKVV